MSVTPLVSVLMTAYNREKYIAEAIKSVLASSYENLELIIVDDGSKDNTVSIAHDFALKDTRIKVFINQVNLGDYPNRNKAASYSSGEFIMYVDSDDILLKNSIKNYIVALTNFPDLNFIIYCDNKQALGIYPLQSKEAILNHYFKKSNLLCGPGGIFIRKTFFEKIGHFPEKYGPANDMYFNVKAASFSEIYINPIDPIIYRIHDQQESKNLFSYIYNNYLFNNDLISEIDLPLSLKEKDFILKKNKRRFVVNVYRDFLQHRNFKKTLQLFQYAKFSVKDGLRGIFHLG